MIASNDAKFLVILKNSKAGPDSHSLLHFAAKNCRPRVCQILIDGINIGQYLFFKFFQFLPRLTSAVFLNQ